MKPCGHSEFIKDCHICELARTRKEYRKIWGIPESEETIDEGIKSETFDLDCNCNKPKIRKIR